MPWYLSYDFPTIFPTMNKSSKKICTCACKHKWSVSQVGHPRSNIRTHNQRPSWGGRGARGASDAASPMVSIVFHCFRRRIRKAEWKLGLLVVDFGVLLSGRGSAIATNLSPNSTPRHQLSFGEDAHGYCLPRPNLIQYDNGDLWLLNTAAYWIS